MFLSFRRRAKISSVSKGETVVIEGSVRATREMSLPGDGTKCVYYEMLIETYKKGDRGMGRPLWFIDRLDRKFAGFYINDGTGEVYVDCPAEQVMLQGGYETGGSLDAKGRRRFNARLIREGDTVRLRGVAIESSGAIEKGVLSIAPDKKGRLEMIAKPVSAKARKG